MPESINTYLQQVGQWLLTSGLRILLILILMFMVLKIAEAITNRLFRRLKQNRDEEFQKRAGTLNDTIKSLLKICIILVALVMILSQLGVKIGPVLAAAGVVGVAVGFGAQHLVRDVISGFFILLDDQIRVGDVVQVGDKGGLVEKVTMRLTVLRDLAGNVHYIRNGEINVVTNMTRDYSRYVFDIGVAYREDVDQVIEVVKQIDAELRQDPAFKDRILEPVEILGLDKFADSALIIKARTKTKPIQQWSVAREFNRRLKKKFDELNIEIPFPHITLYMGQDKTGAAPPLQVSMQKT